MFNQFDDVLGVRKFDFMTGSTRRHPARDGRHRAAGAQRRGRRSRVDAAHDGRRRADGRRRRAEQSRAPVPQRRRLPPRVPGVARRRDSRRANAPERIVWASGRTNELGVLVDADGEPLPCEFFAGDPATGKQPFQPHHEVITSPDQVQIYETLLRNAKGRFTTSFVHGCEMVKDNRLLPRGWKTSGPGPGAERRVPAGDPSRCPTLARTRGTPTAAGPTR